MKLLKIWEKKGMQGWIKGFEKRLANEKKTINKWKIPKTVTKEEWNKARRYVEKELLKVIKILPEDSQDYYKKTFAPFYSETVSPDYFKNKSLEELKEIYTDFITDNFAFIVACGIG